MKWITSVDGELCVREGGRPEGPAAADGFARAFVPRAVHELVFDPRTDAPPLRPAAAVALTALGIDLIEERSARDAKQACFSGPVMNAQRVSHRPTESGLLRGGSDPSNARTVDRTSAVVWFDPHGTLYPPALAAAGVPLERLIVLRVRPTEVAAVAVDCLRCPGVAAVIAPLPATLSRVQARRLQLAAEHGGGVGLILRESGRGSDLYAAATRWRVTAAPGDRYTQRWAVRLTHGHVQGRSIGDTFWLEGTRASSDQPLVPVHPPAPLADHATPAPRATATG